jgi:Peptidase A4 family
MVRARRLAVSLVAVLPLLVPSTAHAASPTGGDWAGYVVHGGTYTSVSATWTQPAVKCTAGDQYSSYWVGLDGYDSDSVEQTGTEADCIGKTAEYSTWYEMYPANPVTYGNTLKPGDAITASVTFSGTDTYTLVIKDATQGWTKTAVKTQAGLARSSAECIVDAPYDGGVLPLADFGTFVFKTCDVDGTSIIPQNPTVLAPTGLTVSPPSSGVLSITWHD